VIIKDDGASIRKFSKKQLRPSKQQFITSCREILQNLTNISKRLLDFAYREAVSSMGITAIGCSICGGALVAVLCSSLQKRNNMTVRSQD
jgi:hypothetical protein